MQAEETNTCPVSDLLSERNVSLRLGDAQRYKLLLLVLDITVITACFFAVSLLRGPGIVTEAAIAWLVVPIGVVLISMYGVEGYWIRNDFLSAGYAVQHCLALGAAMVATLFASFVVVPTVAPGMLGRVVVVISFGVFVSLSLYYRRQLRQGFLRRYGRSLVLFLGEEAAKEQFRRDHTEGSESAEVVFADVRGTQNVAVSGDSAPVPLTGVLDEELVVRSQDRIGAVVCAEPARRYPKAVLRTVMNLRLASVPVFSFESYYEARLRRIPLNVVKPDWILNNGFRIAHDPVYTQVKRMSDIVAAAVGLVLAAPLMAVLAAAVKLTDGGPVFFCQPRVGLNKRIFRVCKFRTMSVGAENGGRYTQADDPRITRVGALLRKWRIDELPQLWNVLKGDMSLIGPRAEWDELVADYEREIPCYHFRHLVKPGITGWAQVNYPYGENLEDTRRKLEYDLYYIRHFSFFLDASIVFKTLYTMLFGKGR